MREVDMLRLFRSISSHFVPERLFEFDRQLRCDLVFLVWNPLIGVVPEVTVAVECEIDDPEVQQPSLLTELVIYYSISN